MDNKHQLEHAKNSDQDFYLYVHKNKEVVFSVPKNSNFETVKHKKWLDFWVFLVGLFLPIFISIVLLKYDLDLIEMKGHKTSSNKGNFFTPYIDFFQREIGGYLKVYNS